MSYLNIKKICLSLALALVMSTSANAAGCFGGGCYDPCCDPCGCPQLCCDANFYVGADVLIWTVCEKDLEFHRQTPVDSTSPTSFVFIKNGDYSWDVGFRAFGGYKVDDCCDWEAYLGYTWYCNDAKGTFTEEELGTTHSFKDKLKYQVFDALVAKEYCVTQCGYIRPFFGFRALWIDQDMLLSTTTVTDPPVTTADRGLDSTLCGYGLHGGAEYHWTVCDCLGVYGDVSASILEGEVKNRHNLYPDTPVVDGVLPDPTKTIVDENCCNPLPGYHLGVGLRYESNFNQCGCDMLVRLDIGYEFHHWLCIPELIRDIEEVDFRDRSGNGNLLLHGAKIGFGLYF